MTALTKEQKDIVEIKGEIGRIRHHLDLQKTTNENASSSLNRIESALIGNVLNGNKGLVQEVNDLQTSVKSQNEKMIQYGVYFVFLGVIATACLGGMITLMIKLFVK